MITEINLNRYDPADIAGSIAYWCWRTERISIENGFTKADQASIVARLGAALVPNPYIRMDADQWATWLREIWDKWMPGCSHLLDDDGAREILQWAIDKDSHSWREWEDTDYRVLSVVHREWEDGDVTPFRTEEDMRAWIAESEDIRTAENDQVYIIFSNGTRHLYHDHFDTYEWYYGKAREYYADD